MKEIEINFIEKVISIMKDNELTEAVLEDENKSLYIRTNGFTPVINVSKKEPEALDCPKEEQIEPQKKLIPIVSNMIGLYFGKPSPMEQPFVKVGDKVKRGQTVCIIETIKLMNKIVSDVEGTVKEICIEDGKPVEYGQTIMYIEQD